MELNTIFGRGFHIFSIDGKSFSVARFVVVTTCEIWEENTTRKKASVNELKGK